MGKLWIIVEVLYKGKELQNKEIWKNAGALTGIVAAALKAIEMFMPDLNINGVDRSSIINGLVSLALVFGSYTHIATSTTVGLRKK
jgi:hypothetical protein